jgi:hypothetical protein
MKFIFSLLLIMPVMLRAQECKLQSETDPFTKQTKLSTGFIYLDGGSISIDADSKEITVLFSIEGSDKCFDNTSNAYVYFEGTKVKLTVRNGGTMNCEGLFQFVYRNTPSASTVLQKLVTQKITQITFTGNNKKESVLKAGPAEQDAIIKLGGCLVTEAKKLITQ